jgi:hypothetical protein
MVWLALLGVPRVVPLAFVEVAIAVALFVMIALGEVVVFLILLVSPPCHHVTQLHGSSRVVAPEVVVRVLREEAMLEAADDVHVGDVGNGGARLKEMPCVRPQGLVHLLLHLDKSWRVPALIMNPWKSLMKACLRSSHESMEFSLRLSSHVRGAGSRATGK